MKIHKDHSALAGVIEALLLIALIAIVISVIQVQYIPQIMEQREAEHMTQISNQFSYLKSMIDIQALTGSSDMEGILKGVPIITQINLGTRELPYLVSAPSYGELHIENNSGKIHAVPPINDTHQFYFSGIPFSSLVFHAYNFYYPEQLYILEGGGIILNQSSGNSVMRADPSISIRRIGDFFNGYIEMTFYLPNLTSVQGKEYTSGFGSCYIRTNYSSYHKYTDTITPPSINYSDNATYFYTNHVNAWNESLHRIFKDFIYEINPITQEKIQIIDISVAQYEGSNTVKIIPLKHPIKLKLIVVDIYCQVGVGWIID